MTVPYLTWLEDDIPDEQLGSKGASLRILSQAGLPIPRTACVVASTYDRLVGPLRLGLSGIDDTPGTPDWLQIAETAREAVTESTLPQDFIEEIKGLYSASNQTVGLESVCVRSSASAEDLPGASFAGLYDSFVNVVGVNQVVESVVRTWASLWSAQAMVYRHRADLGNENQTMAVLIQEFIPAEAAGVAFTADPITGDPERIIVQGAWGLGGAVVDGTVDADTWVVRRTDLAIIERKLGDKKTAMMPNGGGGTINVLVDSERQNLPSLEDEDVLTVVRLALKAEEVFGSSQDVEWTLSARVVNIVQSRPITSARQAPEVEFTVDWQKGSDRDLTWSLVTDSLEPVPLQPLDQDIRHIWNSARDKAVEEIGVIAGPPGGEYRFFNGFLYFHPRPSSISEEEDAALHASYLAEVDALAARGETLWDLKVLPEIQSNLLPCARFSLSDATLPQLRTRLDEMLHIYERHWTLHWMLGTPPLRDRWEATYREVTGAQVDMRARVLSASVDDFTHRIIKQLRELARIALSSPVTVEVIRSEPDEIWQQLAKRSENIPFLSALEAFLDEFGLRSGQGFGSHPTFTTPTWKENSMNVIQIIKQYMQYDLNELDHREAAGRTQRREMEIEFMASVSSESRERVRRDLFLARASTAIMEDHNHYIEQLTTSYLRLTLMEIAARLARRGDLADSDDIFFLRLDELVGLLDSKALDVREIVRERRTDWTRWNEMKPPLTLPETDTLESGQSDQAGTPNQNILRGQSASPGIGRGRARLATYADAIPDVEPGDILVSHNAGPMWTPIFPALAGVVLNEGVMFQHAANIAREYGIPAVIQTKTATERIASGQKIIVNGDEGIVVLE